MMGGNELVLMRLSMEDTATVGGVTIAWRTTLVAHMGDSDSSVVWSGDVDQDGHVELVISSRGMGPTTCAVGDPEVRYVSIVDTETGRLQFSTLTRCIYSDFGEVSIIGSEPSTGSHIVTERVLSFRRCELDETGQMPLPESSIHGNPCQIEELQRSWEYVPATDRYEGPVWSTPRNRPPELQCPGNYCPEYK